MILNTVDYDDPQIAHIRVRGTSFKKPVGLLKKNDTHRCDGDSRLRTTGVSGLVGQSLHR